MASRFAIWACLGRWTPKNASDHEITSDHLNKHRTMATPGKIRATSSIAGLRWPALRAVGLLPRSNRIRPKDQIKPMLSWRIGLAPRLASGTSGQGGSNATWACGSGTAASCYRPDTLVAPCKFMPCCRPGKDFVRSTLLLGPHKTTYGAAWLRQLPSRGTHLVLGAILV
jgi:hypothetical protein